MVFSEAFEQNASIEARRNVFLADVLSTAFQSALDKSLEHLWKHGQAPLSTQKLLSTGLFLFVSAVKTIAPLLVERSHVDEALSFLTSCNSGLYNGSLSSDTFDNRTDFTALDFSTRPSTALVEAEADLGELSVSHSAKEPSMSSTKDLGLELEITTRDEAYIIIDSVSMVFSLVFRQVAFIFDKNLVDLLPLLFEEPGTYSVLSNDQLHVFLAYLKVLIVFLIDEKDLNHFVYIDKAILVIYDIVDPLTRFMSAQRFSRSLNRIKSKTLLKIFFIVDYSATFGELLKVSRPPQAEVVVQNRREEQDHSPQDRLKYPSIQYKSLLRVYALISIFSCCPSSFIAVDKESLVMDIGSLDNPSANVYRNFQALIDFSKATNVIALECHFIPTLCALFNYFYELHPDLLLRNQTQSSLIGWITGHAFESNLYASVRTMEDFTSLEKAFETSKFPFFDSSDKALDHMSSKEAVVVISKKVFELPSFFILSLAIYDLSRNESFVKYLFGSNDEKRIPIFDIWLCVLSYVNQHQKLSIYGRASVRSSLHALLKLTAANSPALANLKSYKINENIWKLCHQKAPYLPLCVNGPNISAFLYCVNVLQITLRFNISKNVSLDNAKIALTVLYQILREFEVRPYEDLINYPWKEVYETLVHFIRFVFRYRNDEDTKYVIEEVFSVFELALSASFAKVIERSTDFFIIGSHIIKSMSYDLFYIMLQEYSPLLQLFEKFIIDETNFKRTRRTFDTLRTEFDLGGSKEINEGVVVPILNRLSLFSDDGDVPTAVDFKRFNYAETFKFWLDSNDSMIFEEEVQYLDLVVLLFSKRH